MEFKDLVGKRFGKLVVLSLAPKTKNRSTVWLCQCDCGNQKVVRNKNLIEGIITDCGCSSANNLIENQKIGRLTLIKKIPACRGANWQCLCNCGNLIIVKEYQLKNGIIKSCGCLKEEYSKIGNFIHGFNKTRIQEIHHAMKERCYNKNHMYYNNYGGRGITICDEWLGKDGLKNFGEWALKNGYNDNLSIDRIDNNANYCPKNCRWSTHFEQQNNTRHNYKIEYNGETLSLSEASRKYKINIHTLCNRLKKWKDIKKSLETPINTSKQRFKNKEGGN